MRLENTIHLFQQSLIYFFITIIVEELSGILILWDLFILTTLNDSLLNNIVSPIFISSLFFAFTL